MSATRPADILRRLEPPAPPDAELLRRFAASPRDEAAFAELLRRHGPLVLGVCRRVTGSTPDAEDAFQATFLVLAQKAGQLRDAGRLGNWLYGVAYRVSRRARRAAARRRTREVAMPNPPDAPARPASPELPDLGPVLDEELAALAACYRDAIVLCDLQGATRVEAARALGVPEGTVSSRLANGRKKLAARLVRRGVALSAAALPLALAELRASAVPNELLARTCGLVLDCAAGGAVPGPLAHLLRGGMAVRRTFVACLAGIAAVGGAVFAARPGVVPPVKEQPPPKVVERAPETPEPKDEPKAKPELKFTTAPRMLESLDIDLGGTPIVVWHPSGQYLAVQGKVADQRQKLVPVVRVYGVPAQGHKVGTAFSTVLDPGARLAAVGEHGRSIASTLREQHLISGRHQLVITTDAVYKDGPLRGRQRVDHIDLDPADVATEVFAPDLKTFRAVVRERNASGGVSKVEVVEADATTGKRTKVLIGMGRRAGYALSADGRRFAAAETERVGIYDLDKADADPLTVKLPERKEGDRRSDPIADGAFLTFSPDGTRLVVSRFNVGWTTVFDAGTGKELPELEGARELRTSPDAHCFGANGRLLVAKCDAFKATVAGIENGQERVRWERTGTVLAVWDTQTGKALKTWKLAQGGVETAFCPTRPMLAILEANGEGGTRLGFWDFSAEVEKK